MLILLLVAGFFSGIATVFAATVPLAGTALPHTQITLTNHDITAYVQDKSSATTKPKVSFAQINSKPTVLGDQTVATPSTEKVNSPQKLGKSHYTISLFGDSMIDTMGKDLPHLTKILKARFPSTQFTLINHGTGATNIDNGFAHLTNSYSYLGETRPAVLEQNPDILVIESFAYNHWDNTQSDLDRQWTTLAKIVGLVKTKSPDTKIILAAAIAPFCPTYTDGSANLPQPRKQIECETVKAYLQNVVRFAQSEGYPLVNAYAASLQGNEGNPKHVNSGDHIHPSDAGKELFSKLLLSQIEKIL